MCAEWYKKCKNKLWILKNYNQKPFIKIEKEKFNTKIYKIKKKKIFAKHSMILC